MRALALAETKPPSGSNGIALGIDVSSGWPIIHDPFTAYGSDGFSSPNMVTFGDLGSGKSFSMKCWIIRNLMLGRRVIVVDKKLQDLGDGQKMGEYSMLARALGATPITLKLGGAGKRVNILDPLIAGESRDGVAGQQLLLETVIEAAVGRGLSEVERKAVRLARTSALAEAKNAGRVAHVGDVTRLLLSPTADTTHLPGVPSLGELALWGREVGFALERLVEEELAGLIDGPTDPSINLDGALTVFDISSLPDEGPAVPIMMSVLNTWMHATLSRQTVPVPTLFVLDEAWHIVHGRFAHIARKNAKLARGIGLSNATLLQHPSDIDASSPAISMIKEAQTALIFRQDKTDDAEAICDLFGWDMGLVPRLQKLPTGVCMVKIGLADPLVCSIRASRFEAEVANTDQAMTSRATLSSIHSALGNSGEQE